MENKSTEYLKSLGKLFTALRQLGYDFDNFQCSKRQRIIFQKLVYALQRAGFNFGYNYNLYINGPYCPSLAEDGYCIARNLDTFDSDLYFNFSEAGKSKINKAKEFLSGNVLDSEWLETICTLDYLYSYPVYRMDKNKLYEKFKELKPGLYNRSKLDLALSQIRANA